MTPSKICLHVDEETKKNAPRILPNEVVDMFLQYLWGTEDILQCHTFQNRNFVTGFAVGGSDNDGDDDLQAIYVGEVEIKISFSQLTLCGLL